MTSADSMLLRARVDVGAGIQQQAQLLHVRNGPHQCGRTHSIGRVGIGPRRKELGHQRDVAVQRGEHQGRGSAGAPRARHPRTAPQETAHSVAIAFSYRGDQAIGGRINRKGRRLACQRVGPVGALIDPGLDCCDLGGRERTCRRHLRTEPRADQAVIQTAAIRVAGADIRLSATAQRIAAPVEPEPIHLLIGTVAAVTVLPKDGLYITAELHPRGTLGNGCDHHHHDSDSDSIQGKWPHHVCPESATYLAAAARGIGCQAGVPSSH